MGTLAAAGTSNSKTATEPLDASPSSRNRIANCPILISSVGLVAMRTPPVLGFTYSNAAELPVLAFIHSPSRKVGLPGNWAAEKGVLGNWASDVRDSRKLRN